jgi:N utilization substance protein B
VSDIGAQRHRARERALELVYEATQKNRSPRDIVAALAIPPDGYTVTLLNAFESYHDVARSLVERYALGWQYERMPLIDRLIMLLALSESSLEEAPPRAVILDEAVELAKTFSTDASGGFVNGVLVACLDDADQG